MRRGERNPMSKLSKPFEGKKILVTGGTGSLGQVLVRRILGGDIYLSDRMANKLLHQYISGASADMNSRLSTLSDRELEVFRLIGEGRSTRQIAEQLHLSIKTVETYQAHIKDKLSLHSGRELVQHAIQSSYQ